MGPDRYLVRTARKQAKRRQAEQEAGRSRLVHGQPKAAKALERAQRAQIEKVVEQHRIEKKRTRHELSCRKALDRRRTQDKRQS